MPTISIDVLQAGTLLCCSCRQPVMINGRLEARWQRDLFGDIGIEQCIFSPVPVVQTFVCAVCNQALALDRADIEYTAGPVDPAMLLQDARFSSRRRDRMLTAENIIMTAVTIT